MIKTWNTEPVCRPAPGGLLELTEDWVFVFFGHDDRALRIPVPRGFRFSASIPQIAWSLVGSSCNPEYWAAACGHDWLYWTESHGSRREFDIWFRNALKSDGVARWKRNVMYYSVRGFGAFYVGWDDADRKEAMRLYGFVKDRPDAGQFLGQFKNRPWERA